MQNINTQQKYDNFLFNNKQNRFKRTEDFINPSTCIEHICLDAICGRIWKPKPSQTLDDDYYCPSCVLHHRNNMERFKKARLIWIKYIPNTFYIFEISDPNYPDLNLIKFGRTQNINPLKRYPNSELKKYKMKLLYKLRGDLIVITRIENFWKKKAEELDIFHNFSIDTFHGKSECILADKYYDKLAIATLCIHADNSDDPDNTGFEFDF